MKLIGSNAMYGDSRVDISSVRYSLETVTDQPAFPRGLGGLFPVFTQRADESWRTQYAFCSQKTSLVEATTDEIPADVRLAALDGLARAAELTNRLIKEAEGLSHQSFSRVQTLAMGVPVEGWFYTHVEHAQLDSRGRESAAPVHLFIETTIDPDTYPWIQARVDFDPEGAPHRAMVREHAGDTYSRRIDAALVDDALAVIKVEEYLGAEAHSGHALYTRGAVPTSVYRRWPNNVLSPRDVRRAEREAQREEEAALYQGDANEIDAAPSLTEQSEGSDSAVAAVTPAAASIAAPEGKQKPHGQQSGQSTYHRLRETPMHSEATYDGTDQRDLRPGKVHKESDYRYTGRPKKNNRSQGNKHRDGGRYDSHRGSGHHRCR